MTVLFTKYIFVEEPFLNKMIVNHHYYYYYYYYYYHNYNKILKPDWLSTALISDSLIGQYASCLSNWIVRAIKRALKWLYFVTAIKNLGISCVLILKRALHITNFVKVMINW